MAPIRTMTGETVTDEKAPQSPMSPTHTDTSTLQGDAIIEIGEDHEPSIGSEVAGEAAQPGRYSNDCSSVRTCPPSSSLFSSEATL